MTRAEKHSTTMAGRNKQHMAWADEPRQGDRGGRGNLSLKGLEMFTSWFLRVCLDRLDYMGQPV
jgi:hypothetical protein